MEFRDCTKKEFFAHIGNLNAHPQITNQYDSGGAGYISLWKTLDTARKVVGRTESDGAGHRRYQLAVGA